MPPAATSAGRRRAAPAPPSPDQVQARRNALWLHAFETGLHDPATGRPRRHTSPELAVLWGVHPRTVRRGIACAAIGRAWLLAGRDDDE